MAPSKAPRGAGSSHLGRPAQAGADMQRSSSATSAASTCNHAHKGGHTHSHSHTHDHTHTHGHGPGQHGLTCSCGNPIHPPSKSSSSTSAFTDLGLGPPSKPLSTTASLKRQRELRDFALIDKLLSRIFWLRFYEDAARLYSTRLTLVAKERLPYLVQNIIAAGGGPGWAAANARSEELRELFRLQIQSDLRELEDRVWHISSEWTYTAIRRMAIINGIDVSHAGLRATDLLTLIPLLEAMCENLEHAPRSNYEIHPVRSIAGTFVSLYPDFRIPAPLLSKAAAAKGAPAPKMPSPAPSPTSATSKNSTHESSLAATKYASFLKYAPDILLACSHHPSGKCSLDLSSSTPWGASLYKITTAASTNPSGTSSPTGKTSRSPAPASPLSPASMLFDALFPSLPRNAVPSSGIPKAPGNVFSSTTKDAKGILKSDLAHAQIELRSILALGLSRLFIVLFQTAHEFDLRSFGENVNLAFGSGYVDSEDIDDLDAEYYGGCECCLDDTFDDNGAGPTGPDAGRPENPLHELWSSITKFDTPPAPPSTSARRKSAKRARIRSQASDHLQQTSYWRRKYMSRYRSIFAPRPGAGLKAWDAVLHYEAIIREEEEEKEKKEEEKRLEREKYGLKGTGGPTQGTPSPAASLSQQAASPKGRPPSGSGSLDIDKLALGIYTSNFPPKRRAGKAKESSECDGRGGGVVGWNSCHEEDVWERDLDSTDDFGIEDYFNFNKTTEYDDYDNSCRCKRVALRYLVAEEHKEDGNAAFRRGEYQEAIDCYSAAHKSEPRLPIYLLNRAMAELKVNRWAEAELDCTLVLRKHRANPKALWRRAKARRAIAASSGNVEKLIGAERDLLDFLAILPESSEGYCELASIRADLCPCFECQDVSQLFSANGVRSPRDALQYLPSSSSHMLPRSCFNKTYKSSPYLLSSSAMERSLMDTPLAKSRDILASTPKGWFPPLSNSDAKAKTATNKWGKDKVQAEPRFSLVPQAQKAQSKKQAESDSTHFDKDFWARVVQDFAFVPDTVCLPEDRMGLHFASDHDLATSSLPCWDLYKVIPM